ncbi:transcriptional repressor DicA [Algoriella xinjiangensis]|uniref:helix-turn-helix domain-containing protein n=1 Tax=Algoriella xinjiangensis TaxID=684065 RepID=UPI000F635B6D|nr:helix-turn-helix transcriptional regulator [Algoriella xinjiangensis]VDH16768.1 transcriptional repressor DicA [Algoriella xinjiangensis]
MLTIGKKIKKLREESKLSQRDFAKKINVSAPYLSALENDKKEVTSKIIQKLHQEFNVSSDWLLFSSDNNVIKKDNKLVNQNDNFNDNLINKKDNNVKSSNDDFSNLLNTFDYYKSQVNEVLYSIYAVLTIKKSYGVSNRYLSDKEYLQLKEVEDYNDKVWDLALNLLSKMTKKEEFEILELVEEMKNFIEYSKMILPILREKLNDFILSTLKNLDGFDEDSKGYYSFDLEDFKNYEEE